MPKILKIAYFTILTSLFFIQNGYCVPALDSVRQIEQPDGTTFAAKLWGDEKAHGWETLDGYTVVEDPATKYWHYARIDKTTQALTADLTVGSYRHAHGRGDRSGRHQRRRLPVLPQPPIRWTGVLPDRKQAVGRL